MLVGDVEQKYCILIKMWNVNAFHFSYKTEADYIYTSFKNSCILYSHQNQ